MEQIIQHIALELAKRITEKTIDGGLSDIDQLASDVLCDCKESAREIIQVFVSEMNSMIREDKAGRKAAGFVLKEKDRPRSILTELGELSFKRDYYYCKEVGKCSAVLDEMIGIKPYARVGDNICAKLLTQATISSYANSSKTVTEGAVSRQTVHNIIKRSPTYEAEIPPEKRETKALHIYADEAHVHMQKPGKKRGKSNQMVPLITVSEGIEKVSKRRHRTINPEHLVDENFSSRMLWLKTKKYIKETYDLDEDPQIFIYGDGARWIKSGLKLFENSVYVNDSFHFEKYLKGISSIYPELKVTMQMHIATASNDKVYATNLIARLKEHATNKKDAKKVEAFESYLWQNWDGIVASYRKDVTGSCTEGQVSHILADRFSRTPMGWSKECLGKLANCRVHRMNGGDITAADFKKHTEVEAVAKEVAADMLAEIGGDLDWSIFTGYEAGNLASGTSFYRTANGGWMKLLS